MVDVGSPPVSFSVPEAILCSTSEFLKAKIKPEWSQEGASIQIPDSPADAFSLYVNWLYDRSSAINAGVNMVMLASAYVLGEGIMDTAFKDTIIDIMKGRIFSDKHRAVLAIDGVDIVKTIYERTPRGSAARKLLAHVFAFRASVGDLSAAFDSAPKEFYYNVALVARKTVDVGMSYAFLDTIEKCSYHCHQGKEYCYFGL